MIEEPLAAAAAPLLALALQGVAVADTVVTVSAGPTGLERWVEIATSIASIVIAVALIAIAIPLIPAAWNSRRLYKRINDTVDDTRNQVRPILQHVQSVADNVDYVSTAVREDVARLQRQVGEAQDRLDQASRATEQRIRQFNALLKVMQEEAEDLFIGTASTARGLRAGAGTFARFQLQRDRSDNARPDEADAETGTESALDIDVERTGRRPSSA